MLDVRNGVCRLKLACRLRRGCKRRNVKTQHRRLSASTVAPG